MRTVGEIVEAVQERQAVDDDELRLALLCLYYDGQLGIDVDAETRSAPALRMRARESFERRFRMMKTAPDKYLGERWTPGTAANSEGRTMSKAILSAARKARP